MSRLVELEDGPSHEEWIWPCACHGAHAVRAVWDDDPSWRAIWVEERRASHSWRERLANAWRSLRGKAICGSEVVLTEEAIADLARFVEAHRPPA